MTRKILCVHLRDDFSGAANVFAQSITALKLAGHEVRVVVGSGGEGGFVRQSHPADTVHYPLAGSRLGLLYWFAMAQLHLFWYVSRTARQWKPDLIYVNALLPAGAIVSGALGGRRVVTHVHEVGMSSQTMFAMLRGCALRFSARMICVSTFVAERLRIPKGQAEIIYNSLASNHWRRADDIFRARQATPRTPFTVTMACSLKWYKGIDSFIALAHSMELGADVASTRFELVLNCEEAELNQFLDKTAIPSSISISRRPKDIFDHYERADLLLNLSHPEGWVETFGMTLLEGMACGVPVVSPRVGGCTELVIEGEGGWQIGSRDIAGLRHLIERLIRDPHEWGRASRAARRRAEQFNFESFQQRLLSVVTSGATE